MRLFVDTSAWFALNDRTDQNHARAVGFFKSVRAEPLLLLTTDYVVDETLTLLRFRVSHGQALNFLSLFAHSPQVAREQVSHEHLQRAESIFRRHRDKLWSFTDCVSFAFMEERGLSDAFAFDVNFLQFGMSVHPACLTRPRSRTGCS